MLGPLSGATSLIVSDVQPSLRTGIAAHVALLASMSPVLARAAEEATRETPAWAYPGRGLTFFPDGPGKGQDRWSVGGERAFQAGPVSLGVTAHVGGFLGTLGKVFVATGSFDTIGWGIQRRRGSSITASPSSTPRSPGWP